jgi:hypothetical protein
MAGEKLEVTLEFLETSDHPLALVWREIRKSGPVAKANMAKVVTNNYPLHRLRALGWVAKQGTVKIDGKRNAHPLYVAKTDPADDPPKPADPAGAARRRLTKLASTALKARSTGLAFDMGKALREIETEARLIRDSLAPRRP